MMKRIVQTFAFAVLSATAAQAQLLPNEHFHEIDGKLIRCYSTEKMLESMAADPALIERRAAVNHKNDKYLARNEAERDGILRAGNVITIPVVVHVVWRTSAGNITDARIMEQINRLNVDFRRQNTDAPQTPLEFQSVASDTEIQFCLATRDPQNNPTTGIVRVQTTLSNIGSGNNYYSATNGSPAWNTSQYLNIWVCEIGGGILGYAYLPGSAPATYDGVVIDYRYFGTTGATPPYNLGRTATHEVGHWLNLEHIWGDSPGCSPDDGVSDTPLQGSEYGGCPSHPQNSCGSNDMFMNYMDYVNDACMNVYTAGQRNRMRTAIQNSRPGLLTSQGCVSSSDDAGISQIIAPNGTYCSGTIVPQVVIRNNGGNTLTSATINYRVDGGATSTQSWSGNLTTNQSQTVTLPSITASNGSHTFEAWTSSPNGQTDGDPTNDSQTANFTVSSGGQALPFMEGFESAGFPYAGWTLNNPDGNVTWARTTTAAKTGVASMFMDNWDYTANGQVDEITLPALNCNTGSSSTVTMTFDLAYSLYSASGYSDTLRVQVSTDCGQTWTTVYNKAGNQLSTTGATTSVEFIPTAAQWRNESIDLSAYNTAGNLLVKFRHTTDYENNLYVDNINIVSSGVSNVESLEQAQGSLAVYPNPTTGLVAVQVNLPAAENIEILLYNSLGQLVQGMRDDAVTNGAYQMDLSSLPAGLYHVQVKTPNQSLSSKLVRE